MNYLFIAHNINSLTLYLEIRREFHAELLLVLVIFFICNDQDEFYFFNYLVSLDKNNLCLFSNLNFLIIEN